MSNSQKFDRQLRLWATDGQQNLERAHVCLMHATATGCEILKNLVLPNIGQFTIVDPEKVTEMDLSNNFFVPEDAIGKARAQETSNLLLELNPQVKSTTIFHPVKELIDSKPHKWWEQFTLIVFSDSVHHYSEFKSIVDICYGKVPVIEANSVGFYGQLRLVYDELTIIQSHAQEVASLRIDSPWPELVDYAKSLNIDNLSLEKFGEIPYGALLVHYRQLFNKTGEKPNRKTFKQFLETHPTIKSFRYAALENVDELLKYYWQGVSSTTIPSNIEKVLQNSKSSTQNSFWVLIEALKKFVDKYGFLPVSGSIADMASSTDKYIELQKVYKAKAEEDKSLLKQLIDSKHKIPDKLIDLVCKHSRYLVVQTGSKNLGFNKSLLKNISNSTDSSAIYVAFVVVSEFFSKFGRYPTSDDLSELVENTFDDNYYVKVLEEFIRVKGVETINMASFIGGLGAQEALKILTHQYVPLNNALVFNGITSSIQKWKI